MKGKNSDQNNQVGSGSYNDFGDIKAFWDKVQADKQAKKEHKLVGLKNSKNSAVYLTFVDPQTDKRIERPCDCDFTIKGILEAKDKAIKVHQALSVFKSATEFWEWYKAEISASIPSMEKDLKTYREIFTEIEDTYYRGKHKNTGRPRSRDIKSDQRSFKTAYLRYFKRFPNWDKPLEYDDFYHALFNYPSTPQGTKFFENLLSVCRKIATVGNNQKILDKLKKIDGTQTEFREEQSIDVDTFLSRYHTAYNQTLNTKNKLHRQAGFNWLWVSAMCVMYGLRPSEIAAAQNLFNPVTIKRINRNKIEFSPIYDLNIGECYYSISDPKNDDLALVIGEFTYFGASTKTGSRVCYPIPSKKLWSELRLREPSLPITESEDPGKFSQNFSKWTAKNIGISQDYAFRHLYNALAKIYGLSPEQRSLNMGHSMVVNLKDYDRNDRDPKSRNAILKARFPISYDAALLELQHYGIDIEDQSVKLILRIIYKLDN